MSLMSRTSLNIIIGDANIINNAHYFSIIKLSLCNIKY
jgi:hypothetical protein